MKILITNADWFIEENAGGPWLTPRQHLCVSFAGNLLGA